MRKSLLGTTVAMIVLTGAACSIIGHRRRKLGKMHRPTVSMNSNDRVSFAPDADTDRMIEALIDMDEAKRHLIYFHPTPDHCDLCHRSLDNETYMIDGGMNGVSYWACMCLKCFQIRGSGIGWGIGQLYLHDDQGWLAVAGFDPQPPDEDPSVEWE